MNTQESIGQIYKPFFIATALLYKDEKCKSSSSTDTIWKTLPKAASPHYLTLLPPQI